MSPEIGAILEGIVVGITSFGAFIELPDGSTGLVHISEISEAYVKEVKDFLKKDDKVKVKVIGKNKKGKFDLSIKKVKSVEKKKEKPSSPPNKVYRSNQKPGYSPKAPYKQKSGYNQKQSYSEPKRKVNFEDRLAQFLKDSEERQLDIKKNTEAKRKKGRFAR